MLLVVWISSGALPGQTEESPRLTNPPAIDLQTPVRTTLCELARTPDAFRGRAVEFRAVVQTGFQTSLLRDDTCSTFIWLAGLDTPAPALSKDRQYQKLIDSLGKKYKPKNGAICVNCPQFKVTATVVGVFEHVGKNDAAGPKAQPGFGFQNSYDSQLVLCGVSNVVAEPIDRSALEKVK